MFSYFRKLKFVFFGSPEFAAIILNKLVKAGYKPELLVCGPDEPLGRKKILTPPATKQLATTSGWQIKIIQPENLKMTAEEIKNINADLFIVAAYAKIIPKEIIELPRLGTIGVHPSLLPYYRGASPIQNALINGEKETGTSIFLIDEKVDHGPVLAKNKQLVTEDSNYTTLSQELAELSADTLIKILPDFLAGQIKPEPQDENKATYTKKFITEDGKVNLDSDSPEIIFRKIKALNPSPGVFTTIKANKKEIRFKLLDAVLNNGKLELLRVQPENKNPMPYKEFLRGYHLDT
ncbi:MAG: methionyl-tRNA formyltransferase [Parcubacteria group bacterium Athens0714_26]|nr:MAG: methionyl-tRNA formyltransferase [Parcubacteria group bacterium Athens1014_26]TSD03813.1 MAG: methionyl-tRNA formyltransferase [Parcubacteria group bacterium Athens0714_26]